MCITSRISYKYPAIHNYATVVRLLVTKHLLKTLPAKKKKLFVYTKTTSNYTLPGLSSYRIFLDVYYMYLL